MSLFKDLIDELKEENLLEETIEEHLAKTADDFTILENEALEPQEVNLDTGDLVFVADAGDEYSGEEAENFTSVELLDSEPLESQVERIAENSFEIVEEATEETIKPIDLQLEQASITELAGIEPATIAFSDTEIDKSDTANAGIQPETQPEIEPGFDTESEPAAETNSEPVNEDEAVAVEEPESYGPVLEKAEYAQRLIDNVKSLQHVQHIISGVQREQIREKPISYDTVPVKQALHKFVEAVEKSDDLQSSIAESALHEELGKWHSVLLSADRKISVAHLRRYCKDTNPALSDEAVSSLARFYRNSPFNEDVRSKFDLVVTRLFTKKGKDDKREPVLHRDEILSTVKELYAEWASVSLYNDENEDSDIILAAFNFEDFVVEANKVMSFDELIRNGFFKRVKNFKEKLQENFFSPLLVAVAVECNVLIGNRYIDLIHAERKKVADRTASRKTRKLQEDPAELISRLEDESADVQESEFLGGIAKLLLEGKRKWFTAAALASFILAVSLFGFGSFSSKEKEIAQSLQSEDGVVVNLEKSTFSSYIRSARIKGDMFFGTTTSAWDKLPYSKKEDLLKKIQLAGEERGYSQVQLSNLKGESVGFGSESGINVIE